MILLLLYYYTVSTSTVIVTMILLVALHPDGAIMKPTPPTPYMVTKRSDIGEMMKYSIETKYNSSTRKQVSKAVSSL